MSRIVLDLETDALDYRYLWCVSTHDLTNDRKRTFVRPDVRSGERYELRQLLEQADTIVMHNGIGFDRHVLRDLLDIDIPIGKIFDTLVASWLLMFGERKSFGLEAIGEHLGFPKPVIEDFSVGATPEMIARCEDDVEITRRWFLNLCQRMHSNGGMAAWVPSLKLEMATQEQLQRYHEDGFYFDTARASELYGELSARLKDLEDEFQKVWPPTLQVVNKIKYRITQAGNEFASVTKARDKYPRVEVDGDDLLCYDYVAFNPGSTKHRVEKLWEAGWKPKIKTKGHYAYDREPRDKKSKERGEKFKFYGWKVCEENLLTLPPDAPESAFKLAEYLTLEGRKADLEEWLGCVNPEDGRIHGQFQSIGGWTHRVNHFKPNQANIFSPFSGEADTPVKKIKKEYDYRLRSLWCVPEGRWMVGCDADGIQLRVLADRMKSVKYRDAILNGSKENGTDIHNVNRMALELPHITRDMAKTFIYAFLLGAGLAKLQEILECTMSEASQARDNFYANIDGLDWLKNEEIPRLARQGYFIGYDGRRVKVPSEHLCLAGMLQNGEALIMKKALTLWTASATVPYKMLTWPHDEFQSETETKEDAIELGKTQVKAIQDAGTHFNLFCPLDGEYRIGRNWAETH